MNVITSRDRRGFDISLINTVTSIKHSCQLD